MSHCDGAWWYGDTGATWGYMGLHGGMATLGLHGYIMVRRDMAQHASVIGRLHHARRHMHGSPVS